MHFSLLGSLLDMTFIAGVSLDDFGWLEFN